jgi:hypothetical protein
MLSGYSEWVSKLSFEEVKVCKGIVVNEENNYDPHWEGIALWNFNNFDRAPIQKVEHNWANGF